METLAPPTHAYVSVLTLWSSVKVRCEDTALYHLLHRLTWHWTLASNLPSNLRRKLPIANAVSYKGIF